MVSSTLSSNNHPDTYWLMDAEASFQKARKNKLQEIVVKLWWEEEQQ
jgi:hypothetical protein